MALAPLMYVCGLIRTYKCGLMVCRAEKDSQVIYGFFSVYHFYLQSLHSIGKDWENLGHEFWGPRLWGTVGWCEGESVFTLAHKTSMGPHKMQHHITLRGWDP